MWKKIKDLFVSKSVSKISSTVEESMVVRQRQSETVSETAVAGAAAFDVSSVSQQSSLDEVKQNRQNAVSEEKVVVEDIEVEGAAEEEGEKKNKYDLTAAIRKNFVPRLRQDGFTGTGRTFRQIRNDWLVLLNFETSRSGTSFAINVALHPTFAPDVRGNPIDTKKMKVQLCEFRRRVTVAGSELWWEFTSTETSLNSALQDALQMYIDSVYPAIVSLTSADSPLVTSGVADFAEGRIEFGGFQAPEVRIALLLARLHQHHGRRELAQAYAQYGLTIAGVAVSLRRDFEEVLQ